MPAQQKFLQFCEMSSAAVVFILIFGLGTTLSADLGENYDVTTMLKLVESSPGVFESYGALTVVARGNARGLPLRRGQTFINASYAGHPCCTSWTHEGWSKLDSAHAQATKPPLDPQETAVDGELATNQTRDAADILALISDRSQEEYSVDTKNVWSGKLPVEGRIRLSFRLSSSETSSLGLYLCDAQEVSDRECVAFIISGYDSKGSFLRYQALHLGKNETDPEVETPFGKFKSSVLHENDTAPLTWGTAVTYNFLVERSGDDKFEVRLDGADLQQKRLMTISATRDMNKFTAVALPDDPGTLLEVRADPTWYGYFRPGGEIRLRYTPPNSGSAHLGIFICSDRFQEDCIGEVISGHYEGAIRYFTGKYSPSEKSSSTFWVAGMEERMYRVTEIGRSEYVRARWEPVRAYTFALNRALDGTVLVRLDGGDEEKDQRWSTPKEYKHIFIASYHHEGKAYVQAALGRCGGSTACTAPAPVWVLGAPTGELRSPSLPASVAKQRLCVTIVARIRPGSRVSVAMQRTGSTERLEMGVLSVSAKDTTQWLTRRFVKNTNRALRDKPLDIVVTATQPEGNKNPIMVQWVTSCNPEGDEDVYTVSESTSMKLVTASLGFDVMVRTDELSSSGPQPNPVCMNGGLLDLVTNKCRCVPGFWGDVCDKGCGPNAFGADCMGKCTKTSAGRQCSGMVLCGAGGACDCAPGLGGPRCEEECEAGRYGTGCQKACGQCREGMACDPYTGRCEEGCHGSLQPPLCIEECGRSAPVVSLITNGADAKADDFPWHAGVYDLEYRNKANPTGPVTIEQICGATLVKPKLLISAAHCFYSEEEKKLQPAKRYKVALGKTYRGWDDPNEKPPDRVQRRDVYWLHVPVRYRGNLGTYAEDIAIIELNIPVVTTIYVAPVCLDWTGGFSSELDSTSRGSVVGWGRTENHEPSLQLRVATLPYVGSDECYEHVTQSFWPYLNKDKFCAGDNKGAAVGNGDSGGGMVFKNHEQQGAWYLRGVVSVGPPSDLSFTAYTNVSSYRVWLSDIRDHADIRSSIFSALLGV